MALAPSPVAPPAAAGPAAPMDTETDAAPMVVATVLKNPDGTYQVIAGDEPEEGGEEVAGAEPMEPAGTTVEGIGQALKAVMDILQTDADGGETGMDQMREGYGDTPPAAPAA